jgi:hypothetical protein
MDGRPAPSRGRPAPTTRTGDRHPQALPSFTGGAACRGCRTRSPRRPPVKIDPSAPWDSDVDGVKGMAGMQVPKEAARRSPPREGRLSPLSGAPAANPGRLVCCEAAAAFEFVRGSPDARSRSRGEARPRAVAIADTAAGCRHRSSCPHEPIGPPRVRPDVRHLDKKRVSPGREHAWRQVAAAGVRAAVSARVTVAHADPSAAARALLRAV